MDKTPMSSTPNLNGLTSPTTDGSLEKKDSLMKDRLDQKDTADELTEEKLELSLLSKKYSYLLEPVKMTKDFVNIAITEMSLPKDLQNRKHYKHFDIDETEPYWKYSYNYLVGGALHHVEYPNSFVMTEDLKKETKTLEETFDPSAYVDFAWKSLEKEICGRDVNILNDLYRQDVPDSKVIVQGQTIKFLNGIVEPIWASLFVYDVKSKQKVSASFHFLLNAESQDIAFAKEFPKSLISNLSKRTAIFSLPQDISGLYWVIFFDKIFQPSGGIDNYLKKKIVEKTLQEKVAEAWTYLGAVRQPFCWSFEPVMEPQDPKKEKTNSNQKITDAPKVRFGSMTFSKLYSHVGDAKNRKKLFEVLVNPGDPHIKKAKQFSGEFIMEVAEGSEERIIMQYGAKNDKDRTEKERTEYAQRLREKFNQIMYFHKSYESPFHLHYQNSLILTFSACTFPNQYHNNILIRVSLRDTDDVKKAVPLKTFLGYIASTSEDSKQLFQFALSGTTYHQKNPEFHDEIRLDITTQFGRNHHFLFEFFQIKSSKPKMDGAFDEISLNTVTKEEIGFAIVPLMNQDVMLADSHHKVHVYKELPQGYLSKLETLEPISQNKAFKFDTKLVSTILPMDPFATRFLARMPAYLEREQSMELHDFFVQFLLPNATSATRELRLASFDKIFPQLPVYLNLILFAISNMKEPKESGTGTQKEQAQLKEAATSAFYALLTIARTCMDSNSKHYPAERDRILDVYVHLIFTNPSRVCKPIYQALCELWVDYLSGSGEESNRSLTQKTTSVRTLEQSPTVTKKRGISIFGRPLGFGSNKNEAVEVKQVQTARTMITEMHKVEPKDTITIAWFLFDIMSKSIALYSQTSFLGSRIKHAWSYLDLQDDELFFNENHLSGLIHQIIKKAFEMNEMKWIRRVNNSLALFVCDMLNITYQQNMLESKFHNNILKILFQYLEQVEGRADEKILCKIKLDFVQVLLDQENFVEIATKLQNRALSRFVVDIFVEVMSSEFMDQVDAIHMLYKALTKWDLCKKYQSAEIRDHISSLMLPILEMLENHDLFNKLEKYLADEKRKDTLYEFTCILFHLLVNRKPEEACKWWINKSSDFVVRLINLMSFCVQSLKDTTNNQAARIALKMSCIQIIKQLSNDFYQRIPQEIQVLESIVMFLVSAINQHQKDATLTQREKGPDEHFSTVTFLPFFVQLLQKYIKIIVADEKSSIWKWCMGTFLKYTEFPLENAHDEVKEGLKILTEPYETQIAQMEQEKLVIDEDSEDNIIFQPDDGFIKAALLDKLVERLTYDTTIENEYPSIFLLTYRSFTNSFTLLGKLSQRFRQSVDVNDKISLRALNVVKNWVENYFYDFDNILVTKLILFLNQEIAKIPRMLSFAKNLKKTMSAKLITNENKEDARTVFSDAAPKPELPQRMKRLMEKEFSILDWSSKEIARQLTLVEFELFAMVQPKECLSGAWAKKTKQRDSPNIVALTDRWNLITQFVSSSIMQCSDVKMRTKLVTKFIEISHELSELQNFHSLTAIIAGLQAVAIHRLKKTWAGVSEEKNDLYKKLSDLVDSQGSYKEMRNKLKQCVCPLIPPMAMYLKDLTFIEDGNQDNIKSKNGVMLINYTKRRHVSKAILRLRDFQKARYNLEIVHHLRDNILKKILDTSSFLTEDQQWDNSLKFEPREK